MPLDRQFQQRLDAWRQALRDQIITPLSPLGFEGAYTMERLAPRDAEELGFAPAPVGTAWGLRREYGWFRARVCLPECRKGERLALLSGLGGEQLVYMDRRALGSVDRRHSYVLLPDAAAGGRDAELLIESYAGHGAQLESFGPCPPEAVPIPQADGPQQLIKPSFLALFNEYAYQLHMDVETLCGLMDCLEEGSLRRMNILAGLKAFTRIVDFEAPPEKRNESYLLAREALRPLLGCKNGTSAPTEHIIGQSHIDLAWLWPLENTYHKAARTYANQLSLMEEYPEYRFLACEPALLEMLKDQDRELYSRFLERVRSSQICPDGAFYAECDTNIPSGESLIRQLMWGQRWFREELGTDSHVAWQPDTFGFSPCLPQLLNGFSVNCFATQKLLRADPECETFPYQDFMWEGADGSCVQALSFFKNNAATDPKSLYERWTKHRSQTEDIDSLLFPFGYGDGGGGADRDMLEYLRREADLEGLPRTRWTSLKEHFELNAENARKKLWKGELYLAWHRGAYTSQRRTKLALKRLEAALRNAEFVLAQADEQDIREADDILNAAWRTLLIHQFHDIAAGVGIRDVHDEAVQALSASASQIEEMTRRLCEKVYRPCGTDENCITAVNTLSFPRAVWLNLPDGTGGYACLPAMSAAVITKDALRQPQGLVTAEKKADGLRVNNGVIRFTLNADGSVSDLLDLRSGIALQEEGMRLDRLTLYKNVESVYDAWELSRDCTQDIADTAHITSMRISGADTPVFTAVTEGRIGISPFRQTMRLRAGSGSIEFELEIDWRETHKLLKSRFETNILSMNALHGMQFCHVERPAHRCTAFARDRYEVCNHRFSALFESGRGAALMNRAIYGISCDEGCMALTLLHAPVVPDDKCDRGPQRFEYAFNAYNVPFDAGTVTQDAYGYDCPPLLLPGKRLERRFARAENALIETVKPAEDKNGAVIRLWEHRGGRTKARLLLDEEYDLIECGMDESGFAPAARGREYTFELKPFEIRTFRLIRPGQAVPAGKEN
ncbi:MAG: alpha-mannosidase [Clostridia bacterium]|nr:alpha-mannosidase [Clostridia bacterium]